jgi:hypothetical protein
MRLGKEAFCVKSISVVNYGPNDSLEKKGGTNGVVPLGIV